MPRQVVSQVIEQDLGSPPEALFAEWHPEPVAAAPTPEIVFPPTPIIQPPSRGGLRFAEDIMAPTKGEPKKKKQKKKGTAKETDQELAARKLRRAGTEYSADEDEEY